MPSPDTSEIKADPNAHPDKDYQHYTVTLHIATAKDLRRALGAQVASSLRTAEALAQANRTEGPQIDALTLQRLMLLAAVAQMLGTAAVLSLIHI